MRWRSAALAGVLLLGAYVALSFLGSPRGYLGTDTGGKVATLRVMAERGRFDPDLGYWAERWDPAGDLEPIAFTSHTRSGKWVNVTTLPALWAGWLLFRLGGYRAALLVPMAGSVAAALAGAALLRRLGVGERRAWWGFAVLGLASPLTIYALDFWEHSLGVALIGWAVVFLVDAMAFRDASGRKWHTGVSKSAGAGAPVADETGFRGASGRKWHTGVSKSSGAGLLLGAAATMRTEALVYLAVSGLILGVVFLTRRVSLLRITACGLAMALAAIVPLAANQVFEQHVVGSTIRATRAAGTVGVAGDAAASRVEEAAVTTVGLEGDARGIALGVAFAALLAVAALHRDRGLALVAAAGAGFLLLLRMVTSGLGFVPGLAPAWTFAVPGAAALPRLRRAQAGIPASARQESALTLAGIALGAIPLVVFFQFRGGAGPQWAGRYLLPSGFLLAVLGLAAALRGRLARPIAGAVAALAVAVTTFGLAWYGVRTHDVARTVATLDHRPEPVIVSDVFHLAREGAVSDAVGDKRWLTLGGTPTATAAHADQVLVDAGVPAFAYVQFRGARPPVPDQFAHFVPGPASDLRLFAGVDLRVTTFTRRP